MATTPPTELPPFPDSPAPDMPGQPTPLPTELPSPTPDVDFPDPTPGDPGGAPGQPVDSGMTGDFA